MIKRLISFTLASVKRRYKIVMKKNLGIILDYGKDGVIVGIEILEASKKMNPSKVEYEVA